MDKSHVYFSLYKIFPVLGCSSMKYMTFVVEMLATRNTDTELTTFYYHAEKFSFVGRTSPILKRRQGGVHV